MRKSTIRKMTNRPVTRQGAKLLNELKSITRRYQGWLKDVEDKEINSNALANGAKIWLALQPTPAHLQREMDRYLSKELGITNTLPDLAMANLATHTIQWIFGAQERDLALSPNQLIEKNLAAEVDPFCGIDAGEEAP